jgi:hypothetical protein
MTYSARPRSRHTDREAARATLTAKAERYERAVNDPKHFATIPPQVILEDTLWRLRWIDCAPEGANHQTAPMQDKNGTPMGMVFSENIGPSKASRDSMANRGRDWQAAKTAQAAARKASV